MNCLRTMAIALFVSGAVLSKADTLINTFGASGTGYVNAAGWNLDSSLWMGKTFTLSQSYTLSTIDIALRMVGDSDQMMINLRSDSAGLPGSILESFTLTSEFGANTSGRYSIASILNPQMDAGTYHVTIEAIGDATGKWNLNNGAGTGLMVTSPDAGGNWTSFTDTNGAILVTGAQVVPEPATMTALAIGGLALLRRRRKLS